MKKKTIIFLGLLALPVLAAGLAIHSVLPDESLEIQVRETKKSPDGKWTAVVQMEVFNTAWVVNDVVYAVRLMGPAQKDLQGDLVMSTHDVYPQSEPSIDWRNGKLLVTWTGKRKPEYFANPVNGVPIVLRKK